MSIVEMFIGVISFLLIIMLLFGYTKGMRIENKGDRFRVFWQVIFVIGAVFTSLIAVFALVIGFFILLLSP